MRAVHRSRAADWPLFTATSKNHQFEILSLVVRREAYEQHGKDPQKECAAWLSRALASCTPESRLELITALLVHSGGNLPSSKVRALRAGPWAAIDSSLVLPAGARGFSFSEHAEGIRFLAEIRSKLGELDRSIELSRDLAAATFLVPAEQAESAHILGLFDTSVRRWESELRHPQPNRFWAHLAPTVIDAGFCAMRATGWFDDPEAGIDIFAPATLLDSLEATLRRDLHPL